MARFYPLYIRRSDGKLEIVSKGKRHELNQPTDEQMDQKPDKNGVSDFYREIPADEAKHVDWRRKLGGMLARELNHQEKAGTDSGYILVTFPENYRLYEHVKKTEKDGRTDIKTKTHAAGGNDRQDAYLYGHPVGRKKRFRSPADFFPHLLWLATDESGDPDNCRCKICCPEDLEAAIPGARQKQEKDKPLKPEPAPPAPPAPPTPPATTTTTDPVPPRALQRTPSATPTFTPPPQLQPSPLAEPQLPDQRTDSEYHRFMYRPGELVWFQRSQAWGLGVILKRWVAHAGHNSYVVQPLSHPFAPIPSVTKTSEQELRPWLAWSVPGYTNAQLNEMRDPPTYATADWQGIMHKRYGNGDLEVDASILAAKSIDASYTPLHPSKTDQLGPSVTEQHFNALFLGAEKVWVGEPVRLLTGSGTDILVVHDVVERIQLDASNPQRITNRYPAFVGDIYCLTHVSHPNPALPTPAAPNNNPQLPRRITEDLAWRNARSIQVKRQAAFWKLKATAQRVSINDVKGRWYEASLLLPILQGSTFQDAAARGEVQEAGLFMNSRHDCQNQNRNPALPKVPRVDHRQETRRETLGQAVPAQTKIDDSDTPPSTVDPNLSAGKGNGGLDVGQRFESTGNGSGGLEEFMNIDGVDDHASSIAGYGQNFGAQGHGPAYF
ncbi:hypothetical protein K431DRAFT_279784 [Polychaeton citri CBS 116435]|uniref:Cryptic loci regulator 2 N-terminal domain-containing protein n=1 Tax=Polychaeton citri CBS 116435 TaxID=1314669 RepID=A0A9P4PY78_9PEZI|nr:hypothetical protein K431DRAFT_279784 [Polychaeton citri CBS 116435]